MRAGATAGRVGFALRAIVRAVLVGLFLLLPVAGAALAQGPQPAPAPSASPPPSFLPRKAPPGAVPPAAATAPTGLQAWIVTVQRAYHQRLAAAIREMRTSTPLLAAMSLAALSFVYGVLHAAGPGHGKAVISSYVLATGETVRRGIALSFLAAIFQALSALVLVAVLLGIVKATGLGIKRTEAWLETLSWALVALVGAWLLWMQLSRRLGTAPVAAAPHPHVHGPGCGHDHHDHAPHHDHHHHHDRQHDHAPAAAPHVHDACCGHAHIPDPRLIEGAWSWRRALPIAAAVGIRPCTGAILVLIFAVGQGLAWAGVFATFAMALGTAITVSVLAALAVGSRHLATRIGGAGERWGRRVETVAGIGGALLVLVLGVVLFVGSLGPGAAF